MQARSMQRPASLSIPALRTPHLGLGGLLIQGPALGAQVLAAATDPNILGTDFAPLVLQLREVVPRDAAINNRDERGQQRRGQVSRLWG